MAAADPVSTPVPRIEARDLPRLAALATLAPFSLLPERGRESIVHAWVCLANAVLPFRRRAMRELMAAVTAGHPGIPGPHELDAAVLANRVRQELLYLQERWRPETGRPEVRLTGVEHLRRALEQGRGCVLWNAPFLFAQLLVKKALHEAGFSLVHLSHYMHGPATSRFGDRMINSIRVRTEDRYLAERVALAPATELSVLRKLARRLCDNRIVSITWAHYGHHPVETPVLGGAMEVATGAPALALSTKAALLPVFAARRAVACYEVSIEGPMAPPEERTRRAATMALLRRFVGRMESRVLAFPDSFYGWSHMSTRRS